MSKRRRKDRLYLKRGRFYADLRDFADVGGGLEAMRRTDRRCATEDRDEASRLLATRLANLLEARDGRLPDGREDPRLEDYAKRHLKIKRQFRRASTVARNEGALRNILGYFGPDVRLSQIDVAGLTDYVTHRRSQPGSKSGTSVSAQSILHELNALGNLFKRAVSEGKADANPVRNLNEKPEVELKEAEYLEYDEAARLLEAATAKDANPSPRAVRYLHPILATFLHTGGRAREVFGLEVGDIDFEAGLVHIRPNQWRVLKKDRHRRHVPLWPDLRATLAVYVKQWDREDGLLFPSPNGGMLKDLRGSLSGALKRAGIDKNATLHTLRHTYTAARLQTTDHGAPVSVYTVMHELGHRSIELIERTYGHLMSVRHRIPVVEYRRTDVIELASRKAESA